MKEYKLVEINDGGKISVYLGTSYNLENIKNLKSDFETWYKEGKTTHKNLKIMIRNVTGWNFLDNEETVKPKILKESVDLITTCCDSIRQHLNRQKIISYSFETDIKSDLETIETEIKSWNYK